MEFKNEHDFEKYLRNIIDEHICKQSPDIVLFENKKAVDILICRNGDNPEIFFIEVKYHTNKSGRLGFGGSKGSGFQPEILSKLPNYFESNLRWIISGEGYSKNKVLFLKSSIMKNYLAGGSIGKKHNNIQKIIFKKEKGINEEELIIQLKKWLIN